MNKIPTEVAFRLRESRGLLLPKSTEQEYENKRVGEIADKLHELYDEIDVLDKELMFLVKGEL